MKMLSTEEAFKPINGSCFITINGSWSDKSEKDLSLLTQSHGLLEISAEYGSQKWLNRRRGNIPHLEHKFGVFYKAFCPRQRFPYLWRQKSVEWRRQKLAVIWLVIFYFTLQLGFVNLGYITKCSSTLKTKEKHLSSKR